VIASFGLAWNCRTCRRPLSESGTAFAVFILQPEVEPIDQGGDARGAGEHVALQRKGRDVTRARIALALASWTAADRAPFAKLFDRFTDEMTRESDARAR
jgi:hypothetical protein